MSLNVIRYVVVVIIIIIIIIIIKSSFDRDNDYCHYVIQSIAGFAITSLVCHWYGFHFSVE
jgi:hypothetical protein